MFKHVIFDFDGTLVDSKDLAVDLFNKLADKYKLPKLNQEDIEHLSTLSVMEKCKFMGVPLYLIPILTMEVMKNYYKCIGSLRTFQGINEVIFRLKEQGFKLSIISSNSKKNVELFLRNNDIEVFDNIYGVSSLFGKESAIGSFIKRYNLNRKELIYVGDEHRDIMSCKANRVKVIAVLWGYDSLELLTKAGPDYVVENPAEIINLVTGNGFLRKAPGT